MENFLLTNRCTRVRVKTSDNHTLKVFSVFYQHPALLHPDGWRLLDHGEKILVDENTMWLLEHHECEFGHQPKDGTILTCKITPKDKTDLNKHWDDMLQYCMEVKRDFAQFVDSQKVNELTDQLESLGVTESKSDSPQECSDLPTNDHTPEKTLEGKGQTPPNISDAD